ncbi:hypothetical protein [Shewanella sp.]|uniref:hypothetical protein n=1 Tax=Shewanella sp. TaxID=50422 RepID=UPI004048C3CB
MNLELAPRHSFKPVTLEELKESIYSVMKGLEILLYSSQDLCECSVSCGVIEWTGSENEQNLVSNSILWKYLEPIWQYAENGDVTKINIIGLDDAYGDLIKWLSASATLFEYSGEDGHVPVLKVMTKFLARLKLDFDIDLESGANTPEFLLQLQDGFVPVSSNWLPQVNNKNLTLTEIGLLAGVSNIRTIRNAQYDKDKPLLYIKSGKTVLVEPEVARSWLKQRRGFVPSTPL